jgi:hypothetical protein
LLAADQDTCGIFQVDRMVRKVSMMAVTPTEPPESDLPKIGAPATRALIGEGYTKLEQLTKVSEGELIQLHGVGPKAIRLLREELASRGLSFAPSDD